MSEVDRILDDALSSYTACEPRAGLAGRVMAHVVTESRTRTRAWWAWGAVAATLCCAVIVDWPRPVERLNIANYPPAVPPEAYVLTPKPQTIAVVHRRPQRILLAITRFDADTAQW